MWYLLNTRPRKKMYTINLDIWIPYLDIPIILLSNANIIKPMPGPLVILYWY
jgi:hypothetical protein